MDGPLSIDPKEIEALDERELPDLVNKLIRAELHALGQPQDRAELNLRIHDPDLGVDARLSNIHVPSNQSTWLPPGLSVWQYKTKIKGPSEALNEFRKPGVQEAVCQGGRYRLVVGEDLSDKRHQNVEKVLKEECGRLKVEPCFKVLNGGAIAHWAEQYPAVFFAFEGLRRPLGSLKDHAAWSKDGRHALRYHRDPSRVEAEKAIRQFVKDTGGDSLLQLIGPRGVGKTRLVLEALREHGLKDISLYADEFEGVPPEFLGWVMRDRRVRCILVVDECDSRHVERLRSHADACDRRVKIIAVSQGSLPSTPRPGPSGVLDVKPLSRDEMRALLDECFPELDQSQRNWVTRLSGGFVKMAVAVAQGIYRQPSMSAAALAREYDVVVILGGLFPEKDQLRCMQTMSLLFPIGWDDEVAEQRKAACSFMGISEEEASRVCHEMVEMGFVSRVGRYRYVTPDIVAIWLAASVWRERSSEMKRFMEQLLTGGAQEAFLRRLRSLGDAELAGPLVHSLLGPSGPLPDLQSINTEEDSKILAMLTEADPESGLRALERILSHLRKENLRELNRGRRQVVWTLQKLAWRRETFHGAARLLLSLAEAENESYTNNATGIWLQLFRPYLSGTEVPGPERLGFLRGLYEGEESHEKRKLVVQAAGAALQIRDVSRGSEGEMLGGYAPRKEWWPSSSEEHEGMVRSAFSLVERGLADSQQEVRDQSFGVMVEDPIRLFAFGLGADFLDLVDRSVPPDDEERKLKARESLEFLLLYFKDKLSAEDVRAVEDRVRRLTGDTFHDRLRRWVGPATQGDWQKPTEEWMAELSLELERLADEVLADPRKLRSELVWLSSPDAANVINFGLKLGQRDLAGRLFLELQNGAKQGACTSLLAAYVRGRPGNEAEDWANKTVDGWVRHEPELASVVLEYLRLGPPDAAAGERLAALLEKGWLRGSGIAGLSYLGWAMGLPGAQVCVFAEALLKEGTVLSCEMAAKLLSWWLDKHPDQLDQVRGVVWQTIESPAATGTPSDWGHAWGSLARRVMTEDPVRAVKALLNVYETEPDRAPRTTADRRLQFVTDVTRQYPAAIWPLVADIILQKGKAALILHPALKGWYAGNVPLDLLVAWCEQHPLDGPYMVAPLCPVSGDRLADPAREILVRYGHDERVGGALFATLVSGFFGGSAVSMCESRLRSVRRWKDDPDPNVRGWASKAEESLLAEIEHWKKHEDEEHLSFL